MFEYVEASTFHDAIPAGHYAMRVLRCWSRYPHYVRDESYKGLTPNQAALAKGILSEIEEFEGKPVAGLSQDQVDDYTNMLWERMRKLSITGLPRDSALGKALLEKLRLAGSSLR